MKVMDSFLIEDTFICNSSPEENSEIDNYEDYEDYIFNYNFD